MAITIQGIRVRSISVERQEDGADKITSYYELMSSAGKVLAKQHLSTREGYGGESVFVPSAATVKLLAEATAAYQKDAEAHLGLI